MLLNFFDKDIHCRSLPIGNETINVYDLLDVKDTNRFTVRNLIVHNCNYGAGPGKIQETLRLQGINISFSEARLLQQSFWKLYSGIKEYESWLQEEWDRRSGWVLNGIGRPICVYKDMKKDLVNRVCQSTGHDCLMFYISYIHDIILEQKLETYPVILDTHDATIWECAEEDAPKLKLIFEEALIRLNNFLSEMGKYDIIKLKGDASIIYNLAEDKGLNV